MSGIRNLKLEVILQAVDRATRPLKAVMQGSKGLSRAVKESRDQLKSLNDQQGRIDAFRSLTRDAKETGDKLAAARQKVKELSSSMAAAGPPTEKMARQLQRAEIAVEKLSLANTKRIEAARAAKTSLDAAGISTNQLASHERRLKEQVESVNRVLTQQSAKLARVSKQQQRMQAIKSQYDKGMETRNNMAGAGAGMTAAGAAAGAALLVPVKEYAQAEDAATQLKVSMMTSGGAVAAEFDKISELANNLGNRLPGTTADFQNMMTMLIRQGMSAKSILGGLGEATGMLAVQLKMPFEEAAEFSAQLQDATRSTEKDMMGLMDVIQRTYYTGVNPDWMLQGFSKLSAGMDTVKMKGLEGAKALAPLLAMANQAGMTDGGSAGNAYRKVFQKSMDSANITGVLNDLKTTKGIDLKLNFTDGKGEFGGLPQMFKELDKLKGLSTETRIQLIKDLYGDDSEVTQVVSLLITKGQAGYDEMMGKMNAQAGMQERVNAQLGTLANLWDAASGTFTNALVRFGEAIAPELKAITKWITDVSEGLGKWAKENPVLANALMKVAGVIAIVLTVLGALTLAMATIFGPMLIANAGFAMLGAKLGGASTLMKVFTGGTGLLRGALGLMGGGVMKLIGILRMLFMAMMANPILAIVALIAAAAIYIWSNWDTLGPKFAALWAGIMAGASAAWEGIKSIVFGVGQAIANFFMTWTLAGQIYTHWDQIMAWMGALPAKFMTLGSQIMQGMVDGITGSLGAVKDAITGAGDSTIDWFKEKLGIHSPSRVFAELGGFTMAGLNQGLTENQAGPLSAVTSFAKQLTAVGAGITIGAGTAMAGALPIDSQSPLGRSIPIDNRPPISSPTNGTGGAAQSSGSPIIINVHPSPGMDAQMLAKMVAAEVANVERQKSARGRSRLGDKE